MRFSIEVFVMEIPFLADKFWNFGIEECNLKIGKHWLLNNMRNKQLLFSSSWFET